MSWRAEVKAKPGDLVEIDRGTYQHWAIYIGDGDVIHLAPECEVPGAGFSGFSSVASDRAMVKKEPLWKVVGDDHYQINNKYDERYLPLPVDEIISRAKAEVGRVRSYNVISYNCEHFVTELRYGKSVSDQARHGLMAGGAVVIGIPVLAVLGTLLYKAVAPRHRDE